MSPRIPRRRPPLFADSAAASLAIAVTLVAACIAIGLCLAERW